MLRLVCGACGAGFTALVLQAKFTRATLAAADWASGTERLSRRKFIRVIENIYRKNIKDDDQETFEIYPGPAMPRVYFVYGWALS